MRVLIADDDRDAADLLAELIRLSLPCEVQVAYDGVEALRRAAEAPPAAVVLDLFMPRCGGIEVAEQLHRDRGEDRPFLIALTGAHQAARLLARIDSLFDRVFSKPLDADQVMVALTGLMRAEPRVEVSYDVAELFSRAVRQVVPIAEARGLAYSFDYRGPSLIVCGDPVLSQCAMHRLLLGLLDMLQAGFVMFRARASLDAAHGSGVLVVQAAGTGSVRPPADVDAVLHRLLLTETQTRSAAASGRRSAQGICPNTHAPIQFSSHPKEGMLLRATMSYSQAVERQPVPLPVAGLGAWVVKSGDTRSDWLQRRLQRRGWRTRRFDTLAQALAASVPRADAAAGAALPELVVVVDRKDLSSGEAQALQASMPAHTACVLAVPAGSVRLAEPGSFPHYDLKVLPFSSQDLDELAYAFTKSSSPAATNPPQDTAAQPPRATILLVDDNEINRLIGRGLLEALGYDVRTSNDGLDAIDHCRQTPPQILLMDLDMPILNGLAATLRLRELQRTGEIAPFPIIAVTADASDASQRACARAGMDAFMSKPLSLDILEAQLRRFSAAS